MSRERFVVVADEAELQRLLGEASTADRGVLISGGRTEPRRRADEEDHLAIGLGALDALVAFEPDDLTITAQAGMSVERLVEIAAEKSQRLAIEVARPRQRSLGGAVAMNEDGFVALLYGELREQVLGLRCVTGDGRLLRAGGRVVKNVTGYDLRKLLCGSAGRLAAITELSFRLRPRAPAEASFVRGGLERAEALALAHELRGLAVKQSGRALRRGPDGYLLVLRAEGAPTTLDALGRELQGFERHEATSSAGLWRDLVASEGPQLVLRHRPSRLGELLDRLGGKRPFITDLAAGRMRIPARADETRSAFLDELAPIWRDRDLELLAAVESEEESSLLTTESDRGIATLEDRIRRVFDPRGILMRGRKGAGLP